MTQSFPPRPLASSAADRRARTAWLMVLALLLAAAPLLLPAMARAQDAPPAGRIEGKLLVKGTRAPVSYADVVLVETEYATTTDEHGVFAIETVPAGEYTIRITEDSIESIEETITVTADETTKLRYYVFQIGYTLDEIVVVGEKEKEAMARQELKKEEITGVPGANNDVIRVVETLPGVAYTSVAGFGESGLVIRGTSPEDSQYYLNGFEIPQLFHFGGFISILNAELVSDIAYYPGAYNVKYGNALGGVIEVTTRTPRTDRFGGVVDLASYSSFALLEGPAGGQASWAASARRSLIDFILPAVVPEDQAEFTLAPRFYDFTGLFNWSPNVNNQFEILVFGSDDAMSIIGPEEEATDDPFSGNAFDVRVSWQRLDARWNYTPNERFTNSLAGSILHVNGRFNFGPDITWRSDMYQPHFRNDAALRLGTWNELRFGVEARTFFFDIEADIIRPPKEGEQMVGIANTDVITVKDDITAWMGGAYVDDIIQPARWVQLVPGARVELLPDIDEYFVDPRLTINFMPTEQTKIKMAGGMYHQWPKPDEMADDFGTKKIEAEVAYLGSLGFVYDFTQGNYIDVQGYYKALDSLVSVTETDDEEPYDNVGEGFVYGAEMIVRKRLLDRLMGWASYTYTVSRRKNRPDSDWRYFDQDQRHNFVILASYMLGQNKQWRFGAKWQYSTGLPYTKIDGSIYSADTDSYLPLYSSEVNGRRRPDFHKLDVRVDKFWYFNTWTLAVYLDLQNVYWQNQPVGYVNNFDYTEEKPVQFPTFMPSLGVQGRF